MNSTDVSPSRSSYFHRTMHSPGILRQRVGRTASVLCRGFDSLSCPLEYQKGLNSWFSICKYSQLHSTLAFLMATASGSGPDRLFSFCLVGRPFCVKAKFEWCLIHVGDVAQIPRTDLKASLKEKLSALKRNADGTA